MVWGMSENRRSQTSQVYYKKITTQLRSVMRFHLRRAQGHLVYNNRATNKMQEQERELSRESSAPEASVLVQRNVVQKIQVKKNQVKKKFVFKKILVKIESVTAEIFLIWSNVVRTNVAWTSVNLIVRICSRCSQEATFKVSSKLGQ